MEGSGSTETKPEPTSGEVQHINLKVLGPDQSEISFKIKRTTPFQRLFEAYTNKTGQDPKSLRFLYEGNRLQASQCPDDLDMDDGDQIQATITQLGGFSL